MPLGIAALGKGNGKFEPPVTYPVEVSSPTGVALGDLRKNGLTDIVAGQIDATSVLLNKGKGKFSDGLCAPLAGANSCGASADFNGDGKPDLAVPRSAGMTIMPGTGKASAPYTTGATIATPGPGCPITGDLNGDGIPDLLFLTSGGASAYLGNGDGTFTFASNKPINGGTLVLGDFNKDGKLDISSSSNQLALGNGDATFRTPITIDHKPPEDGYDSIAAADLNNDGWTTWC
jgi:VCBS repeat protein